MSMPTAGRPRGVERLPWSDGRMRQEVIDVAAQFLDFPRPEHVGEDVETMPPIRVDDVRVNRAVFIETDGPTVSNANGPCHPLQGIALHACRVVRGIEAFVHLGHRRNPVGNAHPAPT